MPDQSIAPIRPIAGPAHAADRRIPPPSRPDPRCGDNIHPAARLRPPYSDAALPDPVLAPEAAALNPPLCHHCLSVSDTNSGLFTR